MLRFAKVFVPFVLLAILTYGCDQSSDPTSPTISNPQQFPFEVLDSTHVTLGDRVWLDLDQDGIQGDPLDEPGIEDVIVYLFDCNDSLLETTTTDEEGFYWFDSLEVSDTTGSYYLKFDLPLDDGLGPQGDVVTPLLPLWLGDAGGAKSLEVIDAEMAVAILGQKEYGKPKNGITKLYAQLLAAKLNVADGADDADIADVVLAADAFLSEYDWNDWNGLDKDLKDSVHYWHGMCDDYNNGVIGPGHCLNEWFFSPQDQGDDDTLDSDVDPLTGLTICIVYTEPVADDSWDAGMYLVIDEGCTHSKGYWKNHADDLPEGRKHF